MSPCLPSALESITWSTPSTQILFFTDLCRSVRRHTRCFGTPYRFKSFQSSSLGIWSKALTRSSNRIPESSPCSARFFNKLLKGENRRAWTSPPQRDNVPSRTNILRMLVLRELSYRTTVQYNSIRPLKRQGDACFEVRALRAKKSSSTYKRPFSSSQDNNLALTEATGAAFLIFFVSVPWGAH